MSDSQRTNWLLAAALLVAVAAAVPLLAEAGLLNTRGGGDSPFLLQRLHQLETALRDGHFPVRWMPDANYGYGYPFYNFYAPLSIYITAVFRIIGFSYTQSIQLSQLTGFIVAAWGAFALARRWSGAPWAGLLAAVAYTLAPFHLVNVYVRGDSLAEFWAMAFYPLVILAADRLFVRNLRPAQTALRVAALALAYAALILSHNISALIFSPFLLLFILLRTGSTVNSQQSTVNGKRTTGYGIRNTGYGIRHAANTLVPIAVALLLALALAAWFFVPALAERDLAQLTAVTAGYFHYNSHFLGTAELPLLQSGLLFDYTVNGRTAFRMGLAFTLLTFIALFVLLWPARPAVVEGPADDAPENGDGGLRRFVMNKVETLRRWLRRAWRILRNLLMGMARNLHPVAQPLRVFILLTVLIPTFMLTPLSRPLWDHLPLLAFTQFPWRFLSVQAFGAALAIGALARLPARPFWTPLLALFLLTTSIAGLNPDHLPLADGDVTAERLAQYEWFTGNIGSTVSAEYLPPAVQPRPFTSRWLNEGTRYWVEALSGEVTAARLVEARTAQQQWQVETAVPSTLTFSTLYWPGWTATVDGQPAALQPAPGSGLITLDAPAGQHAITLRLGRTPVRQAAEWVSLTAVLLVIVLFAYGVAPRLAVLRRRGPLPLLPWVTGAGLLVILTLLAALWPQPAFSRDTLTWDFAQAGYLHHAPQGVPFSDDHRLLNYELSSDEVAAGDSVSIWLHWGGETPPTTVALTTPAAAWPGDAPPVLAARSGQRTLFTLAIPQDAPSGLVIPRVTISHGVAQLASGRARGDLYLRPIRIVNDTPAAAATDGIAVRAAAVQPRAGARLDVHLAWLTPQPLSHNYNVALRLTDASGNFLRLADRQPGYGFQPSSGWRPGEWVYDWQTIDLPPPEEAHERPFLLIAQLYDVAEPQTPLLTRRLGALTGSALTFEPAAPSFDLPPGLVENGAVFGGVVQLRGYTVQQSAGTVRVDLAWQALADGPPDATRFVHLVPADAPSAAPAAQSDAAPQQNSYPLSQWTAGEIVVDPVRLDGIPPGRYRLALGFYRPVGEELVRLTAVDAAGAPLPDDRLLLPDVIRVP